LEKEKSGKLVYRNLFLQSRVKSQMGKVIPHTEKGRLVIGRLSES
jgi:hypothetical protein